MGSYILFLPYCRICDLQNTDSHRFLVTLRHIRSKKAFAIHTKGVINALFIDYSERRKFKMLVNGLAEKMSRVGCIINPRSVPRRANLDGTLFGVIYNFQREILSVRHQAMVSYDQEYVTDVYRVSRFALKNYYITFKTRPIGHFAW